MQELSGSSPRTPRARQRWQIAVSSHRCQLADRCRPWWRPIQYARHDASFFTVPAVKCQLYPHMIQINATARLPPKMAHGIKTSKLPGSPPSFSAWLWWPASLLLFGERGRQEASAAPHRAPAHRRARRVLRQRHQAFRSAGRAADQIRAGHQHEDRQSARPHRAAVTTRPCRRGDQVRPTTCGNGPIASVRCARQIRQAYCLSPVTATTDFLAPDFLNRCGRAVPEFLTPSGGPALRAFRRGARHRQSEQSIAKVKMRRPHRSVMRPVHGTPLFSASPGGLFIPRRED
jgi:hypothetical protein